MNRDRRSSSNDPTDEMTADQSTQSASGIGVPRSGPGVERNRAADRDIVNRTHASTTPRRYDQPTDEDEDPVMPDTSSSLNTKI
jgi:hypothetical protein